MADRLRVLSGVNGAELAALTELCMRSKAHWGYDADFMAACRDALTVRATDLCDALAVIGPPQAPCAMAQVSTRGDCAMLERLFVAPEAMGAGHGRSLYRWAIATAREHGAQKLHIEADPAARGFYERMGATLCGTAPSGSIPDRHLPLLVHDI